MDKLIAFSKPFIEPFLSVYIYSTLLGVLIGVYITYKLTINRDRIIVANDAYRTLYSAFFIKLATIKMNIEIQRKEYGKIYFIKLNKESKKYKKISLIGKQILDLADDFHKMVKKHDQVKFSMIVISRYFAIEQIIEQIRLTESGDLESGEEKKFRENRLARLYYQLACAKISFVQAILEDMRKISKILRIKDKETKKTIKFFLKTCMTAKKKELSKMYGTEESKNVQAFDEKDMLAG